MTEGPGFVLGRPPETDSELYLLVRALWGVTIPRHKVCPDHVAPFTAFADAYFRRNSINPEHGINSIALWHGSRGLSGKSFMLSILGLTIAFLRGSDVNLLGGSYAQSTNIHEHMRAAMEHRNAPRYMVADEGSAKVVLTNRARIRPLTASQRTVRGPHPATLLCVATGTLVTTPAGPLEIDRVQPGQVVLSSSNMRTPTWDIVTATTASGYRSTVVVRSGDSELRCTPDHRLWTTRGWVEAGELAPGDVLLMREEDPRQRRSQDRDVPGVLASREGQEPGSVRLPDLRSGADDLSGHQVSGLPQPGARGASSALSGLRRATQGQNQQALPTLPLALDVLGQGGREVCRGSRDWQGGRANLEGRGPGRATIGAVGAELPTISAVGTLGPGLPARGTQDRDRGTRVLLARPAEECGPGSAQEARARAGRLSGAVLAYRCRASVVDSVRPGPVLATYDITTTTGAFFADGVLAHNCDEIDEMDLKIFDGALGQPMPQKNWQGEIIDPYTVACSTWQNPVGTFSDVLRRAEEQHWPIYRWCYQDTANPIDGWLSQEAIEEKKRSISKEMFRVEYDLGEPSIGNRAFDSEAVERAFSLPFEPLAQKVSKDYEEYVFAHPEHNGDYYIGADWAKEQDYTVIVVLRTDRVLSHGIELVYWARLNRRPYPVMIGMFNDAMMRYNAQGEYDRTGLGNVVNDYIDTRAHGFMMVGDKRAAMLSEYVAAVENGKFRFPKIPTAHIAHKYAQVGDLYSNAKAQGFHLPDEVCALALAYYRICRTAPPASPLLVPKVGDLNRYAKHFATPADRLSEVVAPGQGVVYMPEMLEQAESGGLSLLV